MDINQISTAALRAFSLVGISASFMPALARSRVRLGVTFFFALCVVAIVWSH